ncbi:MAG: hypothetical protein KGQ36_02625 [Rickettsiales bacterium]|nr:hypothetical protein [Rickettsiales bacterium]
MKSQKVRINDIKTSKYFEEFQKNKNKKAIAFIGGPAAEDGALMAALIPEFKNRLDDIFTLLMIIVNLM